MIDALGTKIILKRHSIIERVNLGDGFAQLELSEDDRYRTCLATVASVGSIANEQEPDLHIGAIVHYTPGAILDFMFAGDTDLCICELDAINVILPELEGAV